MDPRRLKAAYDQLELLDERLTHKVRPRSGGGSMVRPSADQLEAKMRDIAEYTVELKTIVHELIVAIASKPKPPPAK